MSTVKKGKQFFQMVKLSAQNQTASVWWFSSPMTAVPMKRPKKE